MSCCPVFCIPRITQNQLLSVSVKKKKKTSQKIIFQATGLLRPNPPCLATHISHSHNRHQSQWPPAVTSHLTAFDLGPTKTGTPAAGPHFAELPGPQMPSLLGRKRSHSSEVGDCPSWHGTAQSHRGGRHLLGGRRGISGEGGTSPLVP